MSRSASHSDAEDDAGQLPLLGPQQLAAALRAACASGAHSSQDYARFAQELRRVRPREVYMALHAAHVGPDGNIELRVLVRLGAQRGDAASGPAASAFLVTFVATSTSVVGTSPE